MDPTGKYIADDGVIEKKDRLGQAVVILSNIIIAALAVLGFMALYTATV